MDNLKRVVLDILEAALPEALNIDSLIKNVKEKDPTVTDYDVKEVTWILANEGTIELTPNRNWKRVTIKEADRQPVSP